jgi:hypothetical protein
MLVVLAGCRSAMQPNPSGLPAAARGLSWVSPDANLSKEDLFYVSDSGADAVYVYRWRTGELKGALTGFNGVNGLCVDRAGDIWVTNAGASELEEYAHGGTQPIATLTDPDEYPFTCSVDPRSGNLAVTNVSVSGPSGNVGVYADASGTPVPYTDSKFSSYFSCAYDDKGNLFVDGIDKRKHVEFAELARGSKTMTNITLRHVPSKIYIAGGLQWDGKYIALGSQLSPAAIYQVQVSGTNGTVVGTTLLNQSQIVIGFWKQGSRVIAPDALAGAIRFYDYPAGGDPTKVLSHSGEPVGAVVSKGS